MKLFSSSAIRAIAVAFVLVLAVATLDAFIYRYAIWKLPNESAWQTDPLFNFEYSIHSIKNKKPDEFRIVLFGSSLVPYGFHTRQLEERLAESGVFYPKHSRVYAIAHQGMHGLEMEYLYPRIRELNPDIILLPVNMVDLRLERPLLLNLMGDLKEPSKRAGALHALCRDLSDMFGVSDLSRGDALFARPECLGLLSKGRAALHMTVESYRLKRLFGEFYYGMYANRYSKGRSYEHYTGIDAIDPENPTRSALNVRGLVARQFQLKTNELLIRRGLEMEIEAEFARVVISGSSGTVDVMRPRGWTNIKLDSISRPGETITVRIDRGAYFPDQDDTFAARLASNTGGIFEPGRRRYSRNDSLLESYSDDQYRRSFEKRILAFERPGWAYLKALYDAKVAWSHEKFDPELPALSGIDSFRKKASADGISLLIMNFPENPLTLSLYEGSDFYRGYLDFLKAGNGRPLEKFMDARAMLKMQMFSDYHHLTYGGAIRLTDETAAWISREFRSQRH